MTCPYCDGIGWRWVGDTVDNASRVPCDPCQGTGKTKTDWLNLLGLLAMLASAVGLSLLVLMAMD